MRILNRSTVGRYADFRDTTQHISARPRLPNSELRVTPHSWPITPKYIPSSHWAEGSGHWKWEGWFPPRFREEYRMHHGRVVHGQWRLLSGWVGLERCFMRRHGFYLVSRDIHLRCFFLLGFNRTSLLLELRILMLWRMELGLLVSALSCILSRSRCLAYLRPVWL
jgi:hypothetical protein